MNGVLDQQYHARIIADRDKICSVAGIHMKFLAESMTLHCGEVEVDWVKKFHRYESEGVPGLLLVNTLRPDVCCQAIAGALVRNHIDARVIPLNTLLDALEAGENMIAPHVLLIPNFYMSMGGKGFPAWKIQILYDLMLARSQQMKSSVVCVEDMNGLKQYYGVPFYNYLNSYKHE